VVLPHIVETERLEHTVAKWLCNLDNHNYRETLLSHPAAAQGKTVALQDRRVPLV